jgi:hypothetical protein
LIGTPQQILERARMDRVRRERNLQLGTLGVATALAAGVLIGFAAIIKYVL